MSSYGGGGYYNYGGLIPPYPFILEDGCEVVANAANFPRGTNPTYAASDFYSIYPQFENVGIPTAVLNQYITIAQQTVLQVRYHENWYLAMAYFIAHYLTLYLRTAAAGSGSTAAQVVGAANPIGLAASKSVGGVSVSYDYGSTATDGFVEYQTTAYGRLFAQLASRVGRGGSFII
jgi:hypothetical protein